ncbi:serine-rich adhesin for platelets-like isoform X2 [Littorina saxatilis]|uniref:serine-rich adhesin for platelets-like isoform X2 n=1 Tax=Littorina saxatilis TaxID=31220 RepID=UPI0038B45ACA
MAKTQRFRRSSPQARSHSTRTGKHRVLKRNRDDSNERRVPYTSGNRRHVYRNSPDPHRRRPGRNQQRSTTDTANFTRRQRTGGFGQHSGGRGQHSAGRGQHSAGRDQHSAGRGQHSAGRGQHSVQQQWRPTRGQRPFGRGKLSFRGKRPFQSQQTVQGQQFTPRGGWQGRGHRRRQWLPREQTRFMAHSDTTDLDSLNTGAHGVDRAGHGIDQASRSNLRVDRISRSSSRVNQVSRSSSQISQSSLPDIVSDKQGTTSTLEQLINQAVDSISDLDTPPGSVGSVDTSDSSADDPEPSDSVQKRKKKKSKMRLTRSGKPSRWDVPPPPSPCSDQEETNTVANATQQAEGHHVQDRLLGLSGSLEKNDPQHAINQLTEKLRSLTSALPAPSEDALAALAPLPSPEIIASSSASITTSPKKVPRPVDQMKKKKGRNQTPMNRKYQLTKNLRSPTSALPAPSEDALAALAPLPSPEIVASSSASITTSPKKVLSTKKPVHVKEKKVNKQNPVNVSHESLPARWQAVDLPAAHSSCEQFGCLGTGIHSKTSRRKPQAKMDEKPVGYDPDQILAAVEPEPGKSVSTKRTVRLKAKPATSGKIPDKEKLKVKPQSGVPESEPRRLVKIKTPQTSIRAVHDQDTRGCEKSASRVKEKALNESVQTSPLKQNPNSSTYQGDPREMPRHSRQAERAEDEDALADSLAHASLQPTRDFDFSQFFQHSRSEEQCFIDSLAQKCSEIKLDKSTVMNLNSEAGDAGRTQREEDALVGSTSWATSDHWHQGLEENTSLTDHQQASAGLDPYQAANIPADAGLWNQGAHQTNPVTTNAVDNSGDAAAWQHGTTQTDSMTTNAAYIPGDAGVWNQGARQTGPITQVSANIDPNQAAYIPGNAGVWNQGAHQTGPITQVSANIDPNQATYIPGNAGVWNQGAHQTGPVTQVSANIDPKQAAYIPGNAGVWNQGARQTHPVTGNSAYIPANQGAHQTSSVTQVSTSRDPYQAAYIPGNAGVWQQDAHQTDSVTQVSTSRDLYQAAYIPGNAGVWQQDAHQTDSVTSNVGQFSANKDTATCQGDGKNTGERRLTEVRTAQPFTEAKTTQAVSPTEVKITQSVPLPQVKTTHPVPSGLGPSKTTPRPEGTGISTQARTRVPVVKKARKGSVTNMNERDKLKALFSVRKKPPMTRMDSSETQQFKSPSKSIKGDPFSSAVKTSPVEKDVSMSCIFTVSKTTDARSDAEKSFSQSVPNPKKALPEVKGVAKPMLHMHTVTSRQAPSAPVPSVAYGMLDDLDQSGDHEKYIDDDDILREIDSCLASPKSRIKNDTREKEEVQTRKDLASCRPMNRSHPSDDTVTASVDVAADGTRKTNTPKAAVASTAGPGTEVLETSKHSTIRSKDFTVKSPESSSVDDLLQSTIVVEQDPSGTTEINISVAITADDDSGKNQVRAGGAASLHVEGTSSRPATGELKDTAADAADDSEYVTTCFDLRLPRQQSLEIHLKPMLQTGDDLGDKIEVEVSTEAGSVTHTASNLLAETHVSRSVICSERTISVVVDNNGDSERCSCLDEACVIKEMDVEIADIPEQLSVERVSASKEHADIPEQLSVERVSASKEHADIPEQLSVERDSASKEHADIPEQLSVERDSASKEHADIPEQLSVERDSASKEHADIPEQLSVERVSASKEHADTDITEENTMPDYPDACESQGTLSDSEKEDKGSESRKQSRTLQKSCSMGADELDETESSTVDGAQEGNLEDGSNKKVQILRKISQEEETLAQSQTEDAVGFPTGESSQGDLQENETVGVLPGTLNKELDNPAELQERLAEENSHDVRTASHSNRVQPSGVTDGSCMETEKGESNDVHTDLHSSQEQPDGESFMDTDLEVSGLCGSAAAPAAMPGTTTSTTPAETLELEDSFSENRSPVSDDSDDSLSDGPDFGSSVIRSTLSTVNTNVSPQGGRSLPAGKQSHASDERPTFSLDSLLSDTKNDEAEEHEIRLMQRDLKRDLLSSKGIGIAAEEEDDTEADEENFTDEQRNQLLTFQQEEGQIREIHPGEAVLSHHPCGHLFTNNLLPTDCGVVTSATHNPLSQLLTNYQPEMLMDILSSDIISLAYGSLPCKEQVQRWLLFLLSCHSNATVVQKCGDQLLQVLQWQMEDIIEGNDKHTWAPRILDILRILVNWGANKDELVFDTAAADATQLGEVVPLHDNGGLPPVGQRNVESVLKVLSCLLQARPPYSTEELNQLLVMVCKVSLDQSLLRECLLSDLQVCMASILDCYAASKWHTAVPWLCRVLGGLSSHHHNQVYVTQLFSPTSLRGGHIQQRLAFFCLHNVVNHCSPTDQQLRDFQIQDLCELISGLRPLLQSDNYQLSSLIHLLDVSVGPAVQHITQRKQLCRLLESVRLIVSEIRDSVQQLDYTKVKGMLLHLCLKWDLSVKASNTKQRKIFNCLLSRPVLVEKLEDRGQMCNEEEGADDLGFSLSDDQHSDEGESEGGGGKRLKTDGELTHRDRDKNLKEPRHGCEGAATSESLSSS